MIGSKTGEFEIRKLRFVSLTAEFHSSFIEDQHSRFLSLGAMTSDQAGTYQCIARSSLGSAKVEFEVTVKDPSAIISATLLESNRVDDHTATVSCVASGSPMPHVSWLDGKEAVVSTDQLNLEKTFARSSIVYLNAAGTEIKPHEVYKLRENFHAEITKENGHVRLDVVFKSKTSVNLRNFKCKAENIHGVKIEDIQLDDLLHSKPLKFTNGKGDEVRLETEVGQTLELDCKVESSSDALVRWVFVSMKSKTRKRIHLIRISTERS
jgi:hypothetical protein